MSTINKEIPVLPNRVGENETMFLNKVWAYVEQNGMKQGFGVPTIAQYMKLSSIQLNRKLRYLTGYSPGKLIIHYRMLVAKRLLCESQHPVKEIAWKCGFQSQASFCRSFNLVFNCSPSQYRNSYLESINQKQFRWKIPLCEEDFFYILHLAREKTWLTELLKTVITNLSNKILTVEQLSAATCLSPCSLNRRIKEVFEVTPQRLIRDLRLQYASELLVTEFGSVADIAYNTGFFDPAHLSRCFKAAFGCNPSAYREQTGQISMRWLEEKLMN